MSFFKKKTNCKREDEAKEDDSNGLENLEKDNLVL